MASPELVFDERQFGATRHFYSPEMPLEAWLFEASLCHTIVADPASVPAILPKNIPETCFKGASQVLFAKGLASYC